MHKTPPHSTDMEAKFLNFTDENFTNLSPFYHKSELDDPDSGLPDLIYDEFSYQASNFGVAADLWDSEVESNNDATILPVSIPHEVSHSRIEHGAKEDFQKLLLDWHEHLGSLPVSDAEEMDVVPEQIPDNIFEDSVYDSVAIEEPITSSVTATPSISYKDDDINIYNLDELLDGQDDADDKLPLKIHEHVLQKMGHLKEEPLEYDNIVETPKVKSENIESHTLSGDYQSSGSLDHVIVVKRELIENCEIMQPNMASELPEVCQVADFAPNVQPTAVNELSEVCKTRNMAPVDIQPNVVNESLELCKVANCASTESVSSETDSTPIKMEEELFKTFPKIKVEPLEFDLKLEIDDCFDVDAVSEQIPVLEAGDLKSLLEQFEASEDFSPNTTRSETSPEKKVQCTSPLTKEEVVVSCKALPHTPSVEKKSPVAKSAVAVSVSSTILQTRVSNTATSTVTSVVATAKQHTTAIPANVNISSSKIRPLTKSSNSSSAHTKSVGTNNRSKNSKKIDCSSPATSLASSGSSSPISQPTTPPQLTLNQKIQEAFSAELIEKLKASGRKKTISVIPAMPSKRSGKSGTRMQDAGAALSRNKLIKIVTGGESIQLDHDYCSMSSKSIEAPRPFYHSNASEYSATPHTSATSLLLPQSHQPKYSTAVSDTWDSSSRKDSGLESGEVSDASEETVGSSNSIDCGSGTVITTKAINIISKHIQPGTSLLRKSHNTGPYLANIATQKQKQKQLQNQQQKQPQPVPQPQPQQKQQQQQKQPQQQKQSQQQKQQQEQMQEQSQKETLEEEQQPPVQSQQAPKKRKLNLEEYRNRLKDRDRAKDRVFIPDIGNIPVSEIPMPDSDPPISVIKQPIEAAESRVRPEMCNAEVQADVSKELDSTNDSEKRIGRLRDYRHRQYRSRRHSSSSSSSSLSSRSSSRSRNSSSSPSRRDRGRNRHRKRSRSRRRRSTRRGESSESGSSSSSRSSRGHSSSRSRSPLHVLLSRQSTISGREKQRQVEERRVIYVGRIDEGTSKAQLRKRFEVFGPVVDISVHFREHGDNYGFVTYRYKADAYKAVEHGNDDPSLPHYDLCFGGRRAFCKTKYADLDGLATVDDTAVKHSARAPNPKKKQEGSFDLLLREAQAKIKKRNKV